MQVIPLSQVKVNELTARLASGAVIAMPTETAYGLIADSTNARAIAKIYRIKGRKFNKPLPVISSSLTQVRRFFYIPGVLHLLAKKYWPGPLSLRVYVRSTPPLSSPPHLRRGKRGGGVNFIKVSSHDDTVVVRVSSNTLLKKLSRSLGRPLTATSANISGKGEVYSGSELAYQFKGRRFQPDIIIDGGKIPKRKPSTIVGVDEGKLVVLRQGEIKLAS
jgi:L-threonylcarbamoyladenylate synthase